MRRAAAAARTGALLLTPVACGSITACMQGLQNPDTPTASSSSSESQRSGTSSPSTQPTESEIPSSDSQAESSSEDFWHLCKKLPSNVVQWARKLFHPTGTFFYHFDLSDPPADQEEFFMHSRRKMTEVEVWNSWHSALKMLEREMEDIRRRIQKIDRNSENLIHDRNTLDDSDLADPQPLPAEGPEAEAELAKWLKRKAERDVIRQKHTTKLKRLANEREMRMSEHDALQAQMQTFHVKINMVNEPEWRALVERYVERLQQRLAETTKIVADCEAKQKSSERERVAKKNDMLKVRATLRRLQRFLADDVGHQ